MNGEDRLDGRATNSVSSNSIPRGLKLSLDDYERCAYVLSVKLEDPQFFRADQRAIEFARMCGICQWCCPRCLQFVSAIPIPRLGINWQKSPCSTACLKIKEAGRAQKSYTRTRATRKACRLCRPVVMHLPENCSWWRVILLVVRQQA